jgi:hypothetical protein
LRESEQTVAKDAGCKPRPQRGVEHVLWQTPGERQADLEILENHFLSSLRVTVTFGARRIDRMSVASNFNNTVAILWMIFDIAIEAGASYENPSLPSKESGLNKSSFSFQPKSNS